MRLFQKKSKATSDKSGGVAAKTSTAARQHVDPNDRANQAQQQQAHYQPSSSQAQRVTPAAPRQTVTPIPISEKGSLDSSSAKSSILSESFLKSPPESNVSPPLSLNDDTTKLEALELVQRNDITRELVKKFIADIWNRGDVELIPRVCGKGLRFNGPVGMDRVGHVGFARMVSTIRDALEDFHCEIHSMVVEGNKAFCRVKFTGKHTSSLLGHSPTGRQVEWMGATEFTCKDDKIIKVWELADVKGLERQLRGPTGSS
jgi:predicted ester cyclase